MFEVQPSSISKYSILGIPYPTKYFDFTSEGGDYLGEAETYGGRIMNARKNYIPN
jgi:hypothetical protein